MKFNSIYYFEDQKVGRFVHTASMAISSNLQQRNAYVKMCTDLVARNQKVSQMKISQSPRLRKPPRMEQNMKEKQKPSSEKHKEEDASKNYLSHLLNTSKQNLNEFGATEKLKMSVWSQSFSLHSCGRDGKFTCTVSLLVDKRCRKVWLLREMWIDRIENWANWWRWGWWRVVCTTIHEDWKLGLFRIIIRLPPFKAKTSGGPTIGYKHTS